MDVVDHIEDGLVPYEIERQARIAENARRLATIGVANALAKLTAMTPAPAPQPSRKRKQQDADKLVPTRKSRRLANESPAEGFLQLNNDAPYDDHDGLEDLLADQCKGKAKLSPMLKVALEDRRCSSKARGRIYNQAVGLTCHFCRQKKLCGEPDCPRCSTCTVSKECIGKTQCPRCAAQRGVLCRACLSVRYGEELEDVRERMASGEWLCPHCYEEEHPDEHWICNSSFCMTKRGYQPTGIAIYDARQAGYPSVAHLLQAKLRKRAQAAGAAAATKAAAKAAQTPAEVFSPHKASVGEESQMDTAAESDQLVHITEEADKLADVAAKPEREVIVVAKPDVDAESSGSEGSSHSTASLLTSRGAPAGAASSAVDIGVGISALCKVLTRLRGKRTLA